MNKRRQVRWACACAAASSLALSAISHGGASAAGGRGGRVSSATKASAQEQRVDIRLRSLTTRATGQLTVEASEGGGRARLTALNLPDPQTVAAGATTYVVWAVSGGRVLRLGELRRDERGNGGLAFERPENFERYSVVVTAEATAAPERPGSPVLSTRAGEVTTLFPALVRDQTPRAEETPRPAPTPTPAADDAAPAPSVTPSVTSTPAAPATRRRGVARRTPGAGFYGEVDEALDSAGGGRLITLDGEHLAPDARGEARAALRSGRAYVRADFQNVPLPSAVGAEVFILWAIIPDGRIIYMGSLPAGEAVNLAEIYVRTAGFDTDDFTLFVTAERQRPAPSPSGRRVLSPKTARLIVK
jgi:hypothetical protein